MEVAVVVVRLLLVGVFALAGITKLVDLNGSRAAVAGFGIPRPIAQILGILLPFAELGVAVLLLLASTARVGAIGAIGLLGAFTIGIAVSLARGQRPDCHCFGQLHSEPVGATTVVRNLVLAALALLVALGTESARGTVADLDRDGWLAVVAALAVLAVLAAVGNSIVGLMRQNGRLLLRIEALEAALDAKGIPIPQRELSPTGGLPVGATAPDFALPGLGGETVTLASLRVGQKPVVLFFTDTGCGPCRELMPQVGEWQQSRVGELTMAIVTRRVTAETHAEVSEHRLQNVVVDEHDTLSAAYFAQVTPGAVLIDDEGLIAAPLAKGNRAIGALVAPSLTR